MPFWADAAAPGGWEHLLVVAVVCGLLVLDDTAWGQTWFSQPLPAGLLVGLLGGDPLTGLAVGLPLQLVLIGNIPVGQTFTGDATVATVGAVSAALRGGHELRASLVTGDAGLPLLGWLLLGTALLSLAGHAVVQAERRAHVPWMLEGHRTLRDGDLARIRRLHRRCLGASFVRGILGGLAATLVLERAWVPLFDFLPGRIVAACAMLGVLLPGIGLGTMVERYGVGRSLPWVAGGLAGGLVLAGVVA